MSNLVIGLDDIDATARRSSGSGRVCKERCLRNLVIGLDDTDAKARRSSARREGCEEGS